MRFKLTLKEKIQETEDVTTFVFTPQDPPAGGLSWEAGQFFKYFLPHPETDDRGVSRYFTNSSAPFEGDVHITTRFVPGDGSSFKKSLQKLEIGSEIEAEGPNGGFIYDDPTKEVVFIAGGIGITPFRSILLDLDHKNLNAPITLLYANRNEKITFKPIFDELAQKHDKLKIVHVLDTPPPGWDGESGRITPELIKKYVPDLNPPTGGPTYYVSGPEPMVEAFSKMLEEMGIDRTKFKQDFFPGYEDEYSLTK